MIRSRTVAKALLNAFELQTLFVVLSQTEFNFYSSIFGYGTEEMEKMEKKWVVAVLLFGTHLMFGVIWTVDQGLRKWREVHSSFFGKFLDFVKKLYKYVLFVPVSSTCLKGALSENQTFETKALLCACLLMSLVLSCWEEYSSMSYRLIEKDFCDRINKPWLELPKILVTFAILELYGVTEGCLFMVASNLISLKILAGIYEYPEIQKNLIFYRLLSISLAGTIIASKLKEVNPANRISFSLFVLVINLVICYHAAQRIYHSIHKKKILKSKALSLDSLSLQSSILDQKSLIKNCQLEIRILVMVLMERIKSQRGLANTYDQWWEIFNRKLMIHKANCSNVQCSCGKGRKISQSQEDSLFVKDLIALADEVCSSFHKEVRLRLIKIYLLIEVASQPLKAYYEIMRIQSDSKVPVTEEDVELLTTETRQCFDQLFLQNKVKNQKLELMKVLRNEKLMSEAEVDLKVLIEQSIEFYSLFNSGTVNLETVKQSSVKLQSVKGAIEERFFEILLHYTSSNKLCSMVLIFYSYFEIYHSRQSEFNKINSQRLLKKRMLDKSEVDVFKADVGVIYIDLAEERGKVKNLSKNICSAFGYPKEDMQNFNINLFMPRIFGRHHEKFLFNFIELGKIKLLSENSRVVFGKNKANFIFPISVSLKAEYLLNGEFGSSALAKVVETSSDFIISERSGKIGEVSEQIYHRVFGHSLRDENQKVSKLQIQKLIPSMSVNLFSEEQDGTTRSPEKVLKGVLIYSDNHEYLMRDFSYRRFNAKSNQASLVTSSFSTSLESASTESNLQLSKKEKLAQESELFLNFLTHLDISKLSALQVSYKLSKLKTAEFEADLIEVVRMTDFADLSEMYSSIVAELCSVAELYKLTEGDEHSQLAKNIEAMHSFVRDGKFETPIKNRERVSLGTGNCGKKDNALPNDKIQELHDETSSVDFLLEDQDRDNDQNFDMGGGSEASSMISSVENESKKQILINAFNAEDPYPYSPLFWGVNTLLLFLSVFLVAILVETSLNLNLMQTSWKNSDFVMNVYQIMEYRKALVEIETLQSNLNHPVSPYIASKTLQLNEAYRAEFERIQDSLIRDDYHENAMVGDFQLHNLVEGTFKETSVIEVLEELFWRFSYIDQTNIQELRSQYQGLHERFDSFLSDQIAHLLQQEQSKLIEFLITNFIYALLILVLTVAALPIYRSFKGEEQKLIELLEYLSASEIKRQISVLRTIKQSLNNDIFQIFSDRQIQSQIVYANADKSKPPESEIEGIFGKGIKIKQKTVETSFLRRLLTACAAFLFIVFCCNLTFFSIYKVVSEATFFEEALTARKELFEMENKAAYLLNVYGANANQVFAAKNKFAFSQSLQSQASEQYFKSLALLSSSDYQKDFMTKEIFTNTNRVVCDVIDCKALLANSTLSEVSFEYLVYSFLNRMEFISPEKSHSLNSSQLGNWSEQNRIEELLLWVEEMTGFNEYINSELNRTFESELQSAHTLLISVGSVLILLNVCCFLFVQYWAIGKLGLMVKRAEDIFTHFDVATLIENTYLTSYFNNKTKQQK